MGFKTTITYPNYQPIPQSALDEIMTNIQAYVADGKYTDLCSFSYLPDGTTYVAERWAWTTEADAQAYLDMVLSYYDVERATSISTVVTEI
jgi:hypothetical protein